jgi:hypothetical protein
VKDYNIQSKTIYKFLRLINFYKKSEQIVLKYSEKLLDLLIFPVLRVSKHIKIIIAGTEEVTSQDHGNTTLISPCLSMKGCTRWKMAPYIIQGKHISNYKELMTFLSELTVPK